MSIDNINPLRQLRDDYQCGLVSALIGAGFSRNVIDAYPQWDELLADIVDKLYSEELKRSSLREVIYRHGALELASEYVEKQNLGHESIDCYIEEHIPFAKNDNGQLIINGRQLTDSQLEVHKALLQCRKFLNIYTTNYDNLLEVIRDYYNINYFKTTIDSAIGLSSRISEHSIIKIHGNINNPEKYEFDGDKNLKYIITKEDYQSYPSKHEPFTSLMKLSMLTGKFCLIGFSGSDPNYLGWLQWMKDVLDKSECTGDEIKVYLVLPDAEMLSKSEVLFYKNHHVQVISLSDKAVLDELQLMPEGEKYSVGNDQIGEKTDIRTKLLALFSYLNFGLDAHEHESQHIHSRYNTIWSDIYSKLRNNENMDSLLSSVRNERKFIRSQKIVHYQEYVIHHLLRKKKEWSSEEEEIFLYAVSDMGLIPVCFEANQLVFAKSLQDYPLWKELELREETLSGENTMIVGVGDKIEYENALRLAFNLEFDKLKVHLDQWAPDENYYPNKALLLAKFEKESAISMLDVFIKTNATASLSAKYNASLVANAIYSTFPFEKYPLDEFWNQNIACAQDVAKYVYEQIDNSDKSLQLYGSHSEPIILNPSKKNVTESIRLLAYFMNEGFEPTICNTSLINTHKWYGILLQMFELFPLPCLYYSLGIHDEKFLRKIGMDYAYSKILAAYHSKILLKLLSALNECNCPTDYIMGLLLVSKELYCTVDEQIWYSTFKQSILLPYLNELSTDNEGNRFYYKNIVSAIDNLYCYESVEDLFCILIGFIGKNSNIICQLINDHLNCQSLKRSEKILESVKALEGYQIKDIFSIYYILYYHKILNDQDILIINDRVRQEDLLTFAKEEYAVVQMSYLLTDVDLLQQLKSIIIQHGAWDCGISDEMITDSRYYKMESLSPKIEWSKAEIVSLFSCIESNVERMENRKTSPIDKLFAPELMNLLMSMVFFYTSHASEDVDDNRKLGARLQNLLNKERGFTSQIEALYSDNYQDVYNVHVSIIASISMKKMFNEVTEIGLLIDRACMKKPNCLENILSDIAYYVEEEPKKMYDLYRIRLLYLLREYQDIDYRALNLNVEWMYKSLNRIARALKDYDESSIIEYWISSSEVLRFNVVRQN